jgi:hypothetical protein
MPPQIMKTFIMAKDKKEVLEAEGTYNGVKADVYSMGKLQQGRWVRGMGWREVECG